ncbi:MAG: class I SAM-dependent methyltransferase [Chloroflexi bacterium]|nr:class I SAM-dependent methyltransferase [Chloroflexota bacterium]
MTRRARTDRRRPVATHAPDGSPIGLYLALGTQGEPELIHSVASPGAEVLDLGCGVGRIAHALIALGHPVVAVDESVEMLAHVRGAVAVRSAIEELDLGRTFPCVLLMSNLVNASTTLRRRRLLRSCRRHVAPDGIVVIERYDPKMPLHAGTWTGEYGGLAVTVERSGHGSRAYARITYAHPDGRLWTHEGYGTPHLLDDDAIRTELHRAGLRLERIFGPKRRWCLGHPV